MRKCATCRSSRRTATPIRAGMRRTRRFPIPRSCSSFRTTIFSACSTARACRWRRWASRGKDGGAVETDARKIWRKFAENYHLFRGTPTRLWLDQSFCELFGMTVRLSAATADQYFDRISECLAKPEFRPRALFEQFKIEVIATTESPLDPLAHHKAIAESGWKGRVVTAYRPDPVIDPEFDGFRAQPGEVRRHHALRHVLLARLSRGAPAAPRLLQAARRDLDRPRARLGADRRPRAEPMPSGCSPRSRRRTSPRAMPSCSAPRC